MSYCWSWCWAFKINCYFTLPQQIWIIWTVLDCVSLMSCVLADWAPGESLFISCKFHMFENITQRQWLEICAILMMFSCKCKCKYFLQILYTCKCREQDRRPSPLGLWAHGRCTPPRSRCCSEYKSVLTLIWFRSYTVWDWLWFLCKNVP